MGSTVKIYSLIAAFLLLSFAVSAQLMPTSTIWGNSKIPLRTTADDSLGYAKLADLKSYFSAGLAGGTVTSVAVSVPTGLSISGTPITSSGTIAITNNMSAGVVKSSGVAGSLTSGTVALTSEVSGTLPVANGGSGATTLTGYVKGNGTSAFTAASTVPTSDLSGTVAIANGGSGQTTAAAAITALTGTQTANYVLASNGTNATLQALTVAMLPSNIPNANLQNSSITTSLTATGTDVTISGSPTSLGGTLTVNVPDASATARGVITTGSQTIAGAKTLTGATAISGGTTVSNSGGVALTVSGSYVEGSASVSTTATLAATSNLVFADATSAAFTITLPAATTAGRTIKIIRTNTNGNNLTITRGGSDTIQGATSVVVASPTTITFRADGTSKWYYEFN